MTIRKEAVPKGTASFVVRRFVQLLLSVSLNRIARKSIFEVDGGLSKTIAKLSLRRRMRFS